MTTLVKDTHKLINFLQQKGYTKEQAEGFVEAVKDFDLGDIVGKSDLLDLRVYLTKTMFHLILGQIAVQTTLFIAVIELLLK